MKTINLTNSELGDLKYKISKFPDGQQDIVITEQYLMDQVLIKSRFNSFKDLELIVATTTALRRLRVKEVHLYIPYLLGARSDRWFVEGGNSYLVDVVAPIINLQGFETVTVMDVHSDVAAACIKNLVMEDNIDLINFSIREGLVEGKGIENIALVSPDGGSLKKIYKVADYLKVKSDIIVCSKYRDTEGKLTRTHVPVNSDDFEKNAVIIDDICDGGRTFINIAEQLKLNNWKGKIYLVVTHGIFSSGFGELAKYFDRIYSTNSVADFDNSLLKQHNVF